MNEQKKILIVDDDSALLNMYRLALQTAGCEVMTTQSAEEALDLVFREKFVLVLLDVMMPQLDGISLIHQWPKRALTPINRVVLITNLAQDSLKVKTKELGIAGCWFKDDLSPEELVARVGRL
jgi:two-component system phosphate regulon response regulator PhoB